MNILASQTISTILKHDRKQNSYKIALLRAINDVVTSFPDLCTFRRDVAVPLRMLAEFWVAYYWGFVDLEHPISQGQRARRDGKIRNDMEFRPALTEFRKQWEEYIGGISRPADGFFVIHELRIPRKCATYPEPVLKAYRKAIASICRALEQPIQYAGPSHWTVFEKPTAYTQISDRTIAVPGTQLHEKCLIITAELWQTFQSMSLWVEALAIHEWSLYTERVVQIKQPISRGEVYTFLTARPDNRRPLTWESNQVDILLLEGNEFYCPWTAKRIIEGTPYDMDHLLPVSVYPTNELWNLIPSDPAFNRHIKRDRLPSSERLDQAKPHLIWDYELYGSSASLAKALKEDVGIRFASVNYFTEGVQSEAIAQVVVDLIEQVAESRNLARF